ncbi:uncharacterized protein FIESC28_01879 [Fusarium coffeatum]|uniref:Rhodopsin domain-containing protein n=1 Tax=Fusarium coffeatum TaxID=231269 RepID=A0A366S984_9HYPO|nr:uncharacterized protein FIESC28_01879 [Fusarium coffeatum]RBR25270.1 hypothetical protein FIESC28_01879 [Fusarium coffeatum]
MSAPQPDPNAPLFGAAKNVDRYGLVVIIWVCFAIATLFVSLRLFVRWHQNRRFLADDCWIIWAWLCALTMAIVQTEQMHAMWYMTYLQAGRIAFDPEEMVKQRYELTKWQFPIIKMFWVILWSVKASFLAIFYRLVKPFTVIRRLWYFVCFFTASALIVCVVCSALTCDPPSDYFHGTCDSDKENWRQTFNIIFSTTVDIASDLMIMALPIAVLPSLQLDRKKKIGLGIVFSLGVIIIAVAVIRMSQVIVKQQVDIVGLAIWGAVETATALVVGCLPALKGLLSRSIKKYKTSRSGRSDPTDYSTSANRRGVGSSLTPKDITGSDCIPLDDVDRVEHLDGGICVHKTFDLATERDDTSSRGEDEEMAIIRGPSKR